MILTYPEHRKLVDFIAAIETLYIIYKNEDFCLIWQGITITHRNAVADDNVEWVVSHES